MMMMMMMDGNPIKFNSLSMVFSALHGMALAGLCSPTHCRSTWSILAQLNYSVPKWTSSRVPVSVDEPLLFPPSST